MDPGIILKARWHLSHSYALYIINIIKEGIYSRRRPPGLKSYVRYLKSILLFDCNISNRHIIAKIQAKPSFANLRYEMGSEWHFYTTF